MTEHLTIRSDIDGTPLRVWRWDADGKPHGAVLIAHGLAEHGLRYARFAAALNARGFHVWAIDHRGHGASMAGTPGAFEWPALVADVAQAGRLLRETHRDIPRILFGHSLGSFAAQCVLLDHATDFAAAIFSGSSDLPAMAELAASGGDVSFAAFNAAFAPNRTAFDWLSRDEAEVDAYVADPLCGFDAPPESVLSLMASAARLADPAAYARVRKGLPLLLLSGDADPLIAGGALFEKLAERWRGAGANVATKLYPGGRHEMLNETNRDEVTADIATWLERAVR